MTDQERLEIKTVIEEVLEDRVIPKLEASDQKLDKISKKVFGNGEVKGCLVWEIEELKSWRKVMDAAMKSIREAPKNVWNYLNSGLILLFVILTFFLRR